VVVRGWEQEDMGSYCLSGMDFQFYKMKRILGLDVGDWLHNNRNVFNAIEY
jgi:hypothetical protein